MARPANKPNPVKTDAATDISRVEEAADAALQLNQLTIAANAKAKELATQIGYEGTLTVGALEDEIRFYQRRTVESMLELGKRLCVLKELTPHGEFEQRVDLLGFNIRSAQRFMSAAIRVSKSDTVSLLATQIKSSKAFLELVTAEDEVVEEIGKLDDIDRLSASQLRAKVREVQADLKARDEVLDSTQKKLTALQIKTRSKVVAPTDWPDALSPISEQIAAAGRKICTGITELQQCRITLFEVGGNLPPEEQARFETALQHLADVYAEALQRSERELANERRIYDKTLDAYATQAEAQQPAANG